MIGNRDQGVVKEAKTTTNSRRQSAGSLPDTVSLCTRKGVNYLTSRSQYADDSEPATRLELVLRVLAFGRASIPPGFGDVQVEIEKGRV